MSSTPLIVVCDEDATPEAAASVAPPKAAAKRASKKGADDDKAPTTRKKRERKGPDDTSARDAKKTKKGDDERANQEPDTRADTRDPNESANIDSAKLSKSRRASAASSPGPLLAPLAKADDAQQLGVPAADAHNEADAILDRLGLATDKLMGAENPSRALADGVSKLFESGNMPKVCQHKRAKDDDDDDAEKQFWVDVRDSKFVVPARAVAGNAIAGRWARAIALDAGLRAKYEATPGRAGKADFRRLWARGRFDEFWETRKQTETHSQNWSAEGSFFTLEKIAVEEGGGPAGMRAAINYCMEALRQPDMENWVRWNSWSKNVKFKYVVEKESDNFQKKWQSEKTWKGSGGGAVDSTAAGSGGPCSYSCAACARNDAASTNEGQVGTQKECCFNERLVRSPQEEATIRQRHVSGAKHTILISIDIRSTFSLYFPFVILLMVWYVLGNSTCFRHSCDDVVRVKQLDMLQTRMR